MNSLSIVKPQKKLLLLIKNKHRHISWDTLEDWELHDRLKHIFVTKETVQLIDDPQKRSQCMDMSVDSQDHDMSLEFPVEDSVENIIVEQETTDLNSGNLGDLFLKINQKGCTFSYSSKLNLMICCLLSKGFSSYQIRSVFEIMTELYPGLVKNENYKLPTPRFIRYVRSCFESMNEYFFRLFAAKTTSLTMLTDGRYGNNFAQITR